MNKTKIFLGLFFSILIGTFAYYIAPENAIPLGTKIDKIIVLKSRRGLQAYQQGKLIKTYKISLGKNPIGAKKFKNDNKTP